MKIGIQGGAGSNHEQVALNLHPEAEIVPYKTFSDLFTGLENREIDSIISAIANNRIQYLPDPYRYLTTSGCKWRIIAEHYLPINFHLLGLPGAKLADIKVVHSQTPAIGQCETFLETNLPNVEVIEESDTALSAKLVADLGDKNHAAIATKRAGEIYGLKPIVYSIQDDPLNLTRFFEIVLEENYQVVAEANKTTMLLTTHQTAGSLANALDKFRDYQINIASLQSRIIPNTPFEMVFFIEFEAGVHQPNVQKLLSELAQKDYKTEIIGSYTRVDLAWNP